MKQEERQLLLQDLAARVPYGLKGQCEFETETDNEFWSETNRFNLDVNLEKISTYGKIRVKYFFDDTIDKESEEGEKQLNLFDFVENYQDYADDEIDIEDFKPYLRPISSMSWDEIYSVAGIVIPGLPHNIDETKGTCSVCCHNYTDEIEQDFSVQDLANGIYGIEGLDWLNEHHFDYRGLIKKGLALEAPEFMYTKN